MSCDAFLPALVSAALQDLFGIQIAPESLVLQKTRKEFKGQKTLVVFPFTKAAGLSPEATAARFGEHLLQKDDRIIAYNVVKGFLNLELSHRVYLSYLQEVLEQGHRKFSEKKETVVVEYSSPNTNKPLHLGHLRNNLLGWSVAELLKEVGYSVKKVSVINDRGIHICKSMVAYQLLGNHDTPESMQIKGDHVVGHFYVEFDRLFKAEVADLIGKGESRESAENQAPVMLRAKDMLRSWEAGDPAVLELWNKMNGWVYRGFDETYRRMGVDFDKLYYESQTYLLGKQVVQEGLKKEIFYSEADGSVWMDLSADGLDKKIVQRSDGTSVYITQDLGTAIERHHDYGFTRMIYVVGNEQDYHFKVLFRMLQKLGYAWADNLYHLSYGMVELPEGKMKSREGTVVDADDLMDEMVDTAAQITRELGKTDGMNEEEARRLYDMIGLGALKYFLLKVDPKKKMLFDPKESIDFQGNTGPFIQYTHARICSLLRKAGHPSSELVQAYEPSEKEKELMVLISEFPAVIQEAAESLNPGHLANYLFDIAREYNQFYHDFPVMRESNEILKAGRTAVSAVCAQTLHKGFSLLGIGVPERM